MGVPWVRSLSAGWVPFGGLPAIGLAACVLLTGCGSEDEGGSAGTAHATGVAPPDWRNATYTMTCDGVVPAGFEATLVNGAARVPDDVDEIPYYDYFDVRLEATASGDIDGDGVPDTVVLLQCSPQPSNGILEEAQVFSGAHGRLGVLPSATTLREATILAPLYDPAGLSVQDGDIIAAMKVYGPQDSHASGPSQRMTVRWHWDGQEFVRIDT
jgi:hypothetical protein